MSGGTGRTVYNVYFVGPPESGKSTVHNTIYRELSGSNVDPDLIRGNSSTFRIEARAVDIRDTMRIVLCDSYGPGSPVLSHTSVTKGGPEIALLKKIHAGVPHNRDISATDIAAIPLAPENAIHVFVIVYRADTMKLSKGHVSMEDAQYINNLRVHISKLTAHQEPLLILTHCDKIKASKSKKLQVKIPEVFYGNRVFLLGHKQRLGTLLMELLPEYSTNCSHFIEYLSEVLRIVKRDPPKTETSSEREEVQHTPPSLPQNPPLRPVLNLSPRNNHQKVPNNVHSSVSPPPNRVSSSSHPTGTSLPIPDPKTNTDDVVLLLGETGSGKSTVVNTLTNYFLSGTLDDLHIAIPTKFLAQTEKQFKTNETNCGDRSQSQTDSCNAYKFDYIDYARRKCTFTLIDTPGLSDSRGSSKDDENIAKIFETVTKQPTLSCIIIVVNGTNSRLTVTMNNVIQRLKGALPDAILEKVVVVLTNCRPDTANFDLNTLSWLKKRHIAYMNNTAFSKNPTEWTPAARKFLEVEWEESMQVCRNTVRFISSLGKTSSEAFSKMRASRFAILQELHDSRLQIAQLHKMQEELAAVEKEMTRLQADAKSFSNFVVNKTVTKTELVDSNHHSTLCRVCSHACHENCGLSEITTEGDNAFRNCAAMTGDNCHVCPSKCSYKRHYHAKKTMRTVQVTLQEVLQDMKDKYNASQTGAKRAMSQVTDIESAKTAIKLAIDGRIASLKKYCFEIKKLCSNFNLVDELHITIEQMKTEARSYQTLDARRSSDKMIESLEGLCAEFATRQPRESAAASVSTSNSVVVLNDLVFPEDTQSESESESESEESSDSGSEPSARPTSSTSPQTEQIPTRPTYEIRYVYAPFGYPEPYREGYAPPVQWPPYFAYPLDQVPVQTNLYDSGSQPFMYSNTPAYPQYYTPQQPTSQSTSSPSAPPFSASFEGPPPGAYPPPQSPSYAPQTHQQYPPPQCSPQQSYAPPYPPPTQPQQGQPYPPPQPQRYPPQQVGPQSTAQPYPPQNTPCISSPYPPPLSPHQQQAPPPTPHQQQQQPPPQQQPYPAPPALPGTLVVQQQPYSTVPSQQSTYPPPSVPYHSPHPPTRPPQHSQSPPPSGYQQYSQSSILQYQPLPHPPDVNQPQPLSEQYPQRALQVQQQQSYQSVTTSHLYPTLVPSTHAQTTDPQANHPPAMQINNQYPPPPQGYPGQYQQW
ncbi:hypothetical protein Pelo_10064 [Pelomyxa schiedti]|nr:hypothetical protein Pelo_10064 [Pelomyxa schiedti]